MGKEALGRGSLFLDAAVALSRGEKILFVMRREKVKIFFFIIRVLAKRQQKYVFKKIPLVARPCKENTRRNSSRGGVYYIVVEQMPLSLHLYYFQLYVYIYPRFLLPLVNFPL